MLPTRFQFIWPYGFKGEDFFKQANQKQELPVAAMFVGGSGRKQQSLQRTFHRCFLPSVGSFGQSVSEEKIFRNRPIRNRNCLWWPGLLMDRDEMSNRYTGHPIDPSYKNCLWRSCLLTDQNEISNGNRGLSIDASYQVSVQLAKRLQKRRIFKISQSETRVAYGRNEK